MTRKTFYLGSDTVAKIKQLDDNFTVYVCLARYMHIEGNCFWDCVGEYSTLTQAQRCARDCIRRV